MAPSPPPPPPSTPGYGTLPPASAAPPTTTAPPQRRLVPGWAYLAAFVLLYSANNAVLALFMARGPPFTICGIMCVGNFLGCASLYPVFFRQITLKNVRCVLTSYTRIGGGVACLLVWMIKWGRQPIDL